MSTYLCKHHLGLLFYDQNGVQRQCGGQNAAVSLSAALTTTGAPANPSRANSGLSHNRSFPSVATIGDVVTYGDNIQQGTITNQNGGMRDQFNNGNITQVS
jgi:hypothetical protein